MGLQNLFNNGNSFLNKKDNEESLENILFNSALFIAIIAGLFAIVWNTIIGVPYIVSILVAVIISMFAILGLYKGLSVKSKSIYYVILTLISLVFLWVTSEGSRGTIPMIFILAIIAFVSISKRKQHKLYFIISSLVLMSLFTLEYFFYDEYFIKYVSEEQRHMDLLLGFFLNFVISYILVSYLKNNYDKEYSKSQRQTQELKELNATKDKFFSIIAHDLRGPFGNILGFTELMADKNENFTVEQMQEFSQMVNKSANQTFQLLENLLYWARMHQGLITYEPSKISLNRLIIESIEYLKAVAKEKAVEIEFQGNDCEVYADELMIQTVVRNLVSNAIKFSKKDGLVTISITSIDDSSIDIRVIDNGIGMDSYLAQNLFNDEVHTKRPGTKGEKSTGLGLILCKDFIDKHGSEIKIKSIVNQGSEFSFILPKA